MTGPSGMIVAGLVARRELLHLVRRPARLAGAIGPPVILWVFLGSGVAESFRPPDGAGSGYARFLLPGMITLVTVFASIFSSLSVIEDRRDGWLRAALVSPAPRWSLAAGRIVGGAVTAWVQAAVLLPAVLLMGPAVPALHLLVAAAAVAVTAIAMTAVGLAFAWRCETAAEYHAVMNVVFMPMWLLSGALFPVDGAAPWLAALMSINPLTWCANALESSLAGDPSPTAWALSILFAATAVGVAMWRVEASADSP